MRVAVMIATAARSPQDFMIASDGLAPHFVELKW
jgi:hypothetical protein